MLIMSIPIISPIDFGTSGSNLKLLPAPADGEVAGNASPDDPDYEVQQNEPPVRRPPPFFIAPPALMAINEIEQALETGGHKDFGWWKERINIVRDALKPKRPEDATE